MVSLPLRDLSFDIHFSAKRDCWIVGQPQVEELNDQCRIPYSPGQFGDGTIRPPGALLVRLLAGSWLS